MTPDFACRIDILKFSPRTIPQQRSYESQGDAVSQVRRLDHKRLGNPATEFGGRLAPSQNAFWVPYRSTADLADSLSRRIRLINDLVDDRLNWLNFARKNAGRTHIDHAQIKVAAFIGLPCE